MEKVQLKGGSLSGTYRCVADQVFIRKEVSVTHNREYGFQRWYSQLKRLQRYNLQFPGLFPKVIRYGMLDGKAYFDLEYIPDAITLQSWLVNTSDPKEIDSVFAKLIDNMLILHRNMIPSESSTHLYFHEEVERKLFACFQHPRFRRFAIGRSVCFNGMWIPTLFSKIDEYRHQMLDFHGGNIETISHGNLTLENILIDPYTQTLTFIDPYEENIIDSAFADYSQILQSSNSKYELYNAKKPYIDDSMVELGIPTFFGLDYFNQRFLDFLRSEFNPAIVKFVRLLEISQFMRMLPFKMEIEEDKMFFFYALGSYLYNQLVEEHNE